MGTTRRHDEDEKNEEDDEADDDGRQKRAVCGINTTLLPLKVFNFFYFGGEVPLLVGLVVVVAVTVVL